MQELGQIHLLLYNISCLASLPLISCTLAAAKEFFCQQALVGYYLRILKVPIHVFDQLFIGVLFFPWLTTLAFLLFRPVFVFLRSPTWP